MSSEKPEKTAAAAVKPFDRIAMSPDGFDVPDARAMLALGQCLVLSGLAPRAIDTPEKAFYVMAMGREMGLGVLQSLQSIGIINGTACPFGDLTVSRIDSSPIILDREEWFEVRGERLPQGRYPRGIKPGDDVAAICQLTYQRPGMAEPRVHQSYFHLEQAEESHLFPATDRNGQPSPKSPWNRFTARMLLFKARNWGARDVDGRVLKGFRDEGEMRDSWSSNGQEEREVEAEVVEKGPIEFEIDPADAEEGPGDEGHEKKVEEDDEADAIAFEAFQSEGWKTITETLRTEVLRVVIHHGIDPRNYTAQIDERGVLLVPIVPEHGPAVVVPASGAFDKPVVGDPLPENPETVSAEEPELLRTVEKPEIQDSPAFPRLAELRAMKKEALVGLVSQFASDNRLTQGDVKRICAEHFPGTPPSSLSKEQVVKLVWLFETGEWAAGQ